MTGIEHRYSDYLETHVQVGVAGDKVVSVRFTDSPEGDSNGSQVLEDIFAYLDGEDVDLSGYDVGLTVAGVERRALERTREIPRGTTVTYTELAQSIGVDDDEFPEVREAIDTNPVPILLPSHRVVAESGLGNFAGPKRVKRRLLELEGGL
ncbi:MAG: methylated-DNA--[protein]-cysteine S-methyltransferase [Halobacteria archaeon]|nr:methylated-DNA--[protein]-cysteine S-methyltransferase [Halobacteria archaeon]